MKQFNVEKKMQQERSMDDETTEMTLGQRIGQGATVVFVLMIIIAVFMI